MANTGVDSAAPTSPTALRLSPQFRRGHMMSLQTTAPPVTAGFICLVGPPGSGVTAVSTELSRGQPPMTPSRTPTRCGRNRRLLGSPERRYLPNHARPAKIPAAKAPVQP